MKRQNNDMLQKLANHKLLLFLIPNFICFFRCFYYYNENFYKSGEVLFYEVIVGCLLFLILNSIVYVFLKKALKDSQKVFCIMVYMSLLYFIQITFIQFLILILFTLILIILFKKLLCFKLDMIVGLTSYIVLILFSFTFLVSIYDICYFLIKSKDYDYKVNFHTDEKTETPNIYWIHCDGMMSQETVNKYYYKDVTFLKNYFEENGYFYNPNANFVGGHGTQRALTALLNPYYYDQFFENYLAQLEETFINKKKRTDFIVSYYELEEKRLNNELFQALKKKNYETIAISDFNQYTSFLTDKFYDFYYYENGEIGFRSNIKDLRYMEKENNSNSKYLSYIRFNHARSLFSRTIFYPIMENINYLNYNKVQYDNLNLNQYPYTQNTKYWISKAIFKSIDDSYSDEKNQFTFIDFKISHLPLNFNAFGELLTENYRYELTYYLGNYIYACHLLIEMLDYIQSYDENAVIVVQADHGIHMLEDEYVMKQFNINETELQEIRNSVINAVYVPEKYRNGEEEVLGNPLNISRYLINNYVGKNYEYID